MKTIEEIKKTHRLTINASGTDGGWASAYLHSSKKRHPATIIFSNGAGWDHVSVSFHNRCPSWEEMAEVKNMFFYSEESCVQYHPKESEYVNQHPYCLHIFRCQEQEMPQPPAWMIGVKNGKRIDELRLVRRKRDT